MKPQDLAERVREIIKLRQDVREIKMFGGICFTLRGNMCCGTLKEDLVVRVGPVRYEKALAEPHARPMDFTGHPLKGFVFVCPSGYKSKTSLVKWIRWAVDFAEFLPAKNKIKKNTGK